MVSGVHDSRHISTCISFEYIHTCSVCRRAWILLDTCPLWLCGAEIKIPYFYTTDRKYSRGHAVKMTPFECYHVAARYVYVAVNSLFRSLCCENEDHE